MRRFYCIEIDTNIMKKIMLSWYNIIFWENEKAEGNLKVNEAYIQSAHTTKYN